MLADMAQGFANAVAGDAAADRIQLPDELVHRLAHVIGPDSRFDTGCGDRGHVCRRKSG